MVRQSRALSVLVTRPDPQGQRFADQLRARFAAIQIVQAPLMRTVFLETCPPDLPFQAILLTSETGARAAGQLRARAVHLPRLALCVGKRTAEMAVAAGFEALSADGDAEALMALVKRRFSHGPLLHLRGHDSTGDIAETLTKGGLETISSIAYAQESCALTEAAATLLSGQERVLVPLFSPRSAQLLADALPTGGHAPLLVAALSPAVAKAAKALRPAQIFVAGAPTGESMLHAVAEVLSLPFDA